MKPVGLKAWYSSGRTFSSHTSCPMTWPSNGALLFLIYYDEFAVQDIRYRSTVGGGDWFVLSNKDHVWYVTATEGPDDGTWVKKPDTPENGRVVQGEYVSDEEYRAAQIAAREAIVWP